MSDSNKPSVDPNTDDLDAFNDLLSGRATEHVETSGDQEQVEEDEDIEEDTLAEDNESETEESQETEDSDEDEEVEEKPKKKNRFQERINELTTNYRTEQRLRQELQNRLDEIVAKQEQTTKAPESQKAIDDGAGPQPDEALENGEPKYPLGEFDPQYIRDLTRFTLKVEREAAQAEERKAREQDVRNQEQAQLATEWNGKLETAQETEYPDIRERIQDLQDTFSGLDPTYGEYLATTIMSMDHGTDVIYHLASNLDEAKRIASMGPAKATIALGRIEARYELQKEEKKEKKLKVSKAPTPPERLNKGSSIAKNTADDTDDLDAFEMKFFEKRR